MAGRKKTLMPPERLRHVVPAVSKNLSRFADIAADAIHIIAAARSWGKDRQTRHGGG